ncbi:MAG: glycosyltransferase family 4 protein [Candidatus Zixiibacteriota bacterium]|nr:MAG: glycosyltransferase family 4 protein [candidate division Zixibacteria bacterium]
MRVIQAIDVRWYNACADFAVAQALALQRAGHDVLLMADPGSPPANKAREMGLNLNEKVYFSSINIIGSLLRFNKIIKEFKPDIIMAHRGESHLLGALAGRINGVPLVRFRGDVRKPRPDVFSRWLNEKLTAGIAVSTGKLKNIYEASYNLNGVPVDVIYPGIDLARFSSTKPKPELKRKFGIEPHEFVIGIVGRLSPVKGHRFFLEAVSKVIAEVPGIRIVIAGEDAQIRKEDILRSAENLGIEKITMPGTVPDVEELVAIFDIGVVSSIGSEMICRVLLEYYAAGIAAVATSINQIEEIVSLSGAGLLVPPGNPAAMADAIKKLALDEELRKTHGEKAQKWMETRGSLEYLGRTTEIFLERVLNG